jgi:hypothetical protein
LNHDAGLLKVVKDLLHVLWLGKQLADATEVPTLDRLLLLNGHLSLVELLAPALKEGSALLDDKDGLGGVGAEDNTDVDLLADLHANLIADGLKNVFKLAFILVNVAGNGPNEFQTVQETG